MFWINRYHRGVVGRSARRSTEVIGGTCVWFLGLVALLGTSVGSVEAQTDYSAMCGAVLAHEAYDKTNISTNLSFALAKRQEMCSQSYQSVQAARQSATNIGFFGVGNGGMLEIDFGRGSSGSQGRITESKFCRASTDDIERAFEGHYEQQIASIAVAAWRECVTKATNVNRLYVNYIVRENGRMFSGSLVRTAATGPTEADLRAINVSGLARDHVECTIGGRKARPGPLEEPYEITETTTAVSCEKTDAHEQEANISFQTSQGMVGPITLPSAVAREEDRMDRLEDAIDRNHAEIRRRQHPIGTIVPSTLEYEDFLALNHFEASDWVPCDGRTIPDAAGTYGSVSGGRIPDLRGVFIRGVNKMGEVGDVVPPLEEKRKNPGDLEAGAFQADTFGKHAHTGQYKFTHPSGIGGKEHANMMVHGGYGGPKESGVQPEGGNETRPKNVSVWYYIRIQ